MKLNPTKLPGVFIVEPAVHADNRGVLTKPFHKQAFADQGLVNNFEESFYSISHKDVIRGMHFQTPPQDHAKLIYVPRGAILDVVLDIRRDSPTYGQYIASELSAKNFKMMYIPRGCAHGFLALRNNSCTLYLQETMRSAEHEGGIHFDSFGMNWGVKKPILSDRDQSFPTLTEYQTPFI
jgi:dTDP-4-dehydrorhamnose 3,5-epimerase